MHTSRISYGDQPAMRQSGEVEWPDGMSREVRVRYFDTRTGESRKAKQEPPKRANRRMDDQAKLSASLARARAKTIERCAQPVIVDGVEYPSVNSAAKAVGCAGCTITRNLRNGATEYKGHSIRFKDPRHARA